VEGLLTLLDVMLGLAGLAIEEDDSVGFGPGRVEHAEYYPADMGRKQSEIHAILRDIRAKSVKHPGADGGGRDHRAAINPS
jgi:hypothetical protein